MKKLGLNFHRKCWELGRIQGQMVHETLEEAFAPAAIDSMDPQMPVTSKPTILLVFPGLPWENQSALPSGSCCGQAGRGWQWPHRAYPGWCLLQSHSLPVGPLTGSFFFHRSCIPAGKHQNASVVLQSSPSALFVHCWVYKEPAILSINIMFLLHGRYAENGAS